MQTLSELESDLRQLLEELAAAGVNDEYDQTVMLKLDIAHVREKIAQLKNVGA